MGKMFNYWIYDKFDLCHIHHFYSITISLPEYLLLMSDMDISIT